MDRKHIVFITGLHIWSLGAQRGASSFYETLKGYSDHGFYIDLVTCNRIDGLDLLEVKCHYCNLSALTRLVNIRKVGFIFHIMKWIVYQAYGTYKLLFLVRQRRPLAIYAYEHYGVPAAMLIKRITGVPVITRFQGTIMKPRLKEKLWRLRYWDHWIALRARADLVIMANDGTQGDQVLDAFGVPRNLIRFWPNGLKLNRVDYSPADQIALRQQLDIADDTFVLLTVSRLVKWKRLDRIINAMPAIVQRCPNVRLVIVGDGKERVAYENIVRELSLTSHVTFTGAIPQTDVSRYMAISDLFISLYDLSNIGNPLLESMSAGNCIVTLNNGDTGSIITNNINGILLEQNSLNKLPDTITSLLKNKHTRYRIGNNAKQYATTNFHTWPERMQREVAEVENMLLKHSQT